MMHDESDSRDDFQKRWVVRLILAALLQRIREDHEVSPLIIADACGEEFVSTYLEHGTVEDARAAVKKLAQGVDAQDVLEVRR